MFNVVGWPSIILGILCAYAWRKHRQRQGKKVAWYIDFFVAAGMAFVADVMIGFLTGFVPAFTQSFGRSFIEAYKRSSGGATPSMTTVYGIMAAYATFLIVVLIGLILVGRYIWKRSQRRKSISV